MNSLQKKILISLILLSLLPAVSLINADMMDIDSAQYAEIAREMTDSDSYLFIRDNGRKYLDKPIMTFWLVSASFKLFGQNNIAFRLPSLIFALLSLYSIYRITVLRSQSERRGLLASLLYASSPGLLSMLVSPLIDIYLTSFLIFIHHAYYLARKKNANYFYLMYFFMGCGFITKGPIAVVIPGISIGVDLLIRRDWKGILSMKIPQGIFVTAALPLFWSYVLFQEFSWYGPNFFIIIQSFGRFYSFIYNQKFDPLFFVKNFAWAFGLFFVPLAVHVFLRVRQALIGSGDAASASSDAIWKRIPLSLWNYVRSDEFRKADFVIPLWLFLTLSLISFSRFQLPQYIYWILPGGAIYMAGVLDRLLFGGLAEGEKPERMPAFFFYLVPALLLLFYIAIPVVAFDLKGMQWFVYLLCLFPLALWPVLRRHFSDRLIVPVLSGLVVHLTVGWLIYGLLIFYQPSSRIAETVRRLEPGEEVLYKFMISNSQRSYAFYSQRLTRDIFRKDQFEADLRADGSRLVILSGEGLLNFPGFTGGRYDLEILEEHDAYKVSMPSQAFFNKKKRPGVLKKVYLIRVTLRNP